MGPRVHDMELKDIVDIILRIRAGRLLVRGRQPAPRARVARLGELKLPEGASSFPASSPNRRCWSSIRSWWPSGIVRFACVVGRENVIAGADCGFAIVRRLDGDPSDRGLGQARALADGRAAGYPTALGEELVMTDQLVTYAVDGRVGIVSLNRADKLNAISPEMKRALVECFHQADREPATSVVVLRAEGRSFCAGYDIAPNPARTARRGNALAWRESLTDDVALELTPWDMKKPVIASVQGHAWAAAASWPCCATSPSPPTMPVRRARDPIFERRPRAGHAVGHRAQAGPRAPLPGRPHRRPDALR